VRKGPRDERRYLAWPGDMGAWPGRRTAVEKEEVAARDRAGFDLGMTLIGHLRECTADRAEALVGEAIAGRRGRVFLVFPPQGASRKGDQGPDRAAWRNIDCRRLGTDRLDSLSACKWRGKRYRARKRSDGVCLFNCRLHGQIRYWGLRKFRRRRPCSRLWGLDGVQKRCDRPGSFFLLQSYRRGIGGIRLMPCALTRNLPDSWLLADRGKGAG